MMAFNLSERVKELFTPSLVAKAASVLHESEKNILNVSAGAIPAIIEGMAHFAGQDSGNGDKILDATKETIASGLMENTGSLIDNNNLFTRGSLFLQEVMGTKFEKAGEKIGSFAGTTPTAATSLMSWLAPLTLGVIGEKAEEENIDAHSISDFLSGQSKLTSRSLPAGLADLTTLFKSEEGDNPRIIPDASFENTEYAEQRAGGRIVWLWPLLILGFIAFLYFMLKGTADDLLAQEPNAEQIVQPASDSNIKGSVNENGDFVYDVGELTEFTLPDGTTLTVGENSTEAKLLNFLTDANAQVSEDKTQGWIVLDRVYFVTGASQLTPESQQQIKNIALILKNFPNAEVKMGGYTDNTGRQEVNLPLSSARAKAAADEIVKNNIAAERVASEGYGSDHPICAANDTPECRAQNRRVDIRVTKK